MPKARVVITADNQLKSPLKQAQNDLTGFEKAAKNVGNTLKTAFTVTAIVAGLKALKDAVADCVDAFKLQNEAMTRLQASIKATGQAYKYTANDIKTYATELQAVTRFSDSAIEETASLLVATQKFDKEGLERTISLSADLAEAMGTDLSSAATTLQKALVEPGEGLTRLRTIGITFTDAEKEMIESLKDAGKEFEAQQIILDKVEKAYGGMAESIASVDTSTLDKIKNVWGDLKEDIGNVFTNTLGPVFEWIYSTLRWLERLASQVAEKSNFNKWMNEGNTQRLADNFTSDYLNKELTKALEDSTAAYNELANNYWLNQYLKGIDTDLDEFLRLSTKQRTDLLTKISNNDTTLVDMMNQQAIAYDVAQGQIQTLTKALAVQRQDTLKAFEAGQKQQEKLIQEQNEALIKSVGGLAGVFSSATDFAFREISGGQFGQFITKSLLGSGISDSASMSILNGQTGMWAQTTQAFMSTMYNWIESLPSYATDRTSGLGLNGTVSSNFGLQNTPLSFKDTMSILGPAKVKQYLDMGSKDIQNILSNFGKYSKSYQEDILNKNIDTIQNILDNMIEPGSQLYDYFSEILDELKNGNKQEEKDNRTFLEKFSANVGAWAANITGADESQGKAFGTSVMGSFVSNMGTAGEVVGKLATNMATMGPLLGAIATALEYVFQGLAETIGPVLEEFVKFGIEPLREFGRVIGEVLSPLIETFMPLVKKSAESLMSVFNGIGAVLQPIIEIIGMALTPILDTLVNIIDAISPVLDGLAKVLIGVVGTIQYLIQGLQHWVAVVFNWLADLDLLGYHPFEGLRMTDPGNPGSYMEFMQNKYADYEAKKASVSDFTNSGSTQTALSSASYTGATNVTINIYATGPFVGENGMRDFARMIRDEFDALDYYGVSA